MAIVAPESKFPEKRVQPKRCDSWEANKTNGLVAHSLKSCKSGPKVHLRAAKWRRLPANPPAEPANSSPEAAKSRSLHANQLLGPENVHVRVAQTEKCKSISRKIVSIASNSHTSPPKMGFFGCTQKDVIPGRPIKPRVSRAPIKKWALGAPDFLIWAQGGGRTRGHTKKHLPPPVGPDLAKVPIFGGILGILGTFFCRIPVFVALFAPSASFGGFVRAF